MDVSEQTFDDAVLQRSYERPVVVDFWAEWCGPCHALAPVLEGEIEAREGAVELVKVDVDANPALAAQFGVSGIPAVKAFRAGKVVREFVGAQSRVSVHAPVPLPRPARQPLWRVSLMVHVALLPHVTNAWGSIGRSGEPGSQS